jgi:hypothetical protein
MSNEADTGNDDNGETQDDDEQGKAVSFDVAPRPSGEGSPKAGTEDSIQASPLSIEGNALDLPYTYNMVSLTHFYIM